MLSKYILAENTQRTLLCLYCIVYAVKTDSYRVSCYVYAALFMQS
jgi:hypothetical protein